MHLFGSCSWNHAKFVGVNLPFKHAKDTQIQEEQQIRPPPPRWLIIKTYLAEMIDNCVIWRGSAFNSNTLDLHPWPSISSSSSLHWCELICAPFFQKNKNVISVDLNLSRPGMVRSNASHAGWNVCLFYICGTLRLCLNASPMGFWSRKDVLSAHIFSLSHTLPHMSTSKCQ